MSLDLDWLTSIVFKSLVSHYRGHISLYPASQSMRSEHGSEGFLLKTCPKGFAVTILGPICREPG